MNGNYHGKGTTVWIAGSSYTGEYSHGYFHGKGVLEYVDGSVYEGDFVSGNPQGRGTEKYADGSFLSTFEESFSRINGMAKADLTALTVRSSKGTGRQAS